MKAAQPKETRDHTKISSQMGIIYSLETLTLTKQVGDLNDLQRHKTFRENWALVVGTLVPLLEFLNKFEGCLQNLKLKVAKG